jgi:cell division protease FtsH
LLPVGLLIFFWWMMASRGEQIGNRIMSFGKVRTKIHSGNEDEKTTFKDVAGVDEAKEELKEVIEFLKDPKRFQKLGGKIPKGVLLVGPPGCGKTLIARAVSGEAGVPFFSISGSDFVEMFVGVGASRVRDLFEQGRRAAKSTGSKGSIIFIDEIDAVGRLRFSGIGGGHDEREQTLNALLVEMDGFDTTQGLILIAATNRPDTLDPAILRPGRFDRHIVVNLPDILGRQEILKVHTRKIKLDVSVNLKSLASQTPGFSGADLANLCNEAALLAARFNKETVEMVDFEKSVERVLMGPEKKSRIMSKKEREITALHESGHSILSLLLPEVNPLKKVSIIPRGLAGGYTFTPPLEDRHYWTKRELLAEITMMLGGRAAEELLLGEVTTGAQNDLETATNMARRMVCQFGMSDKLGNMTLGKREGLIFLGRDIVEERNYSESTARLIDEEVKQIVDEGYEKARALLEQHTDKLKLLSDTLLEKEVLDGEAVKKLLGIEKNDLI